ncbi:hypothetical protein Tco_1238804, partial [Tanacetum coccineum]
VDREKLVVECGNGEIMRQRIIKEYLPTFVCRLHQSDKYKRNLGEDFSLAVGKGFIDATFMEKYEELFDKRLPYVDKVTSAYLHHPLGLQNIMRDETGPTPGQGPRPFPTVSIS